MTRTFGSIPSNESGWPDGVPGTGAGGIESIVAGTGIAVDDTDPANPVISATGDVSEAWPVGSVFISVVSTNPNTLLGYGTWTSIGAGRVLVGIDSGDADFDVVEETGGSKTVAAAGTVSQPTFTGSALGTHSHGIGTYSAANESAHTHGVTSNVAVAAHTVTQPTIAWPAGVPTAAGEASHTHTYTQVVNHVHTLATGTGATGNFSQVIGTVDTTSGGTGATPTQTALGTLSGNPTGGVASGTTAAGSSHTHTISWPAGVPTASGGAVDAHSVTNNAVTSGAGSAHTHSLSGSSEAVSAGTPAGTVSQPTFTGSPTSVLQPYLVVYMWKRTA